MSGSRNSGFFETEARAPSERLHHLDGTMPIRIGETTWQVIRGAITGIARSIQRANDAAERRQLRILCAQRHRRWD